MATTLEGLQFEKSLAGKLSEYVDIILEQNKLIVALQDQIKGLRTTNDTLQIKIDGLTKAAITVATTEAAPTTAS